MSSWSKRRKFKVDVSITSLVFGVLKVARKLLQFDDYSNLIAEVNGTLLEDKTTVDKFEAYSLLLHL